jgi:hypothetical protein
MTSSVNIQMAEEWIAEAEKIERIAREVQKAARYIDKASMRAYELRRMAADALELELDTLDGSRVAPGESEAAA